MLLVVLARVFFLIHHDIYSDAVEKPRGVCFSTFCTRLPSPDLLFICENKLLPCVGVSCSGS